MTPEFTTLQQMVRRGALVLLLALGPGPVAATAAEWLDVPEPSWDGLEAPVAAQLRSLRDHVVARVADPDVPALELAEAFGELGRHYHAYELPELAAACYETARRLAPGDFRWPYLTGYLYQSGGRLEAAAEMYERALEIFGQAPPALIRLGQTYHALNRPQEAELAYRAALALNPTSAAAFAGLGQLLHDSGRHEEAIANLGKALELEPEADRLYYPLGLSYRALGDLERAAETLVKHGEVGVRPADPVVDGLAELTTGERIHLIRGRAAFDAERFAEAAEEFRRAVELRPDSVRARVNLGTALARLGEVDRAIAELEHAVELAPGNGTAHFNLGALHERRGDHEAALRSFTEAASWEPQDAEIRLRLADALRRQGDLERALPQYGKAVAIEPGLESAWVGEADVLARLGRLEEALNRLETAHQLIPTSGQITHGLARLLAASPDLAQRDGERALELAQRVVEALPTVPHIRTLTMALAEIGRCEQAAEWLRQAAEAAREAGEESSLAVLDQELARYAQGPPCRPPGGVGAGSGSG